MKGEVMRTGYSPYDLLEEANRLIELLPDLLIEEQIILLLNKAQSMNVSTYQLSISHKKLADKYYELSIFGSSLIHYGIALELNNKISVKRKIKELSSIDCSELHYSLDESLEGEPDYSNLKFYTLNIPDEYYEQRNRELEQRYSPEEIAYHDFLLKNTIDVLHLSLIHI